MHKPILVRGDGLSNNLTVQVKCVCACMCACCVCVRDGARERVCVCVVAVYSSVSSIILKIQFNSSKDCKFRRLYSPCFQPRLSPLTNIGLYIIPSSFLFLPVSNHDCLQPLQLQPGLPQQLHRRLSRARGHVRLIVHHL